MRIDVHHFHHIVGQITDETQKQILTALGVIQADIRKIMSANAELIAFAKVMDETTNKIAAAQTAMGESQANISQDLDNLLSQLAEGEPVTAEQLAFIGGVRDRSTAVANNSTALAAAAAGIAARVDNPVPIPVPEPINQ